MASRSSTRRQENVDRNTPNCNRLEPLLDSAIFEWLNLNASATDCAKAINAPKQGGPVAGKDKQKTSSVFRNDSKRGWRTADIGMMQLVTFKERQLCTLSNVQG